ncbi:MAG TPA: glycosyl transferase [Stenotrophomonas sp.]|nr:glycosyl transferase [Stenotrophomonas sp.]
MARILLITRNLPPLVGGMERLNWHIADELSRHAEVRMIGPAGSAARRPPRMELAEVPLHPLWRFLSTSAWRAACIARDWKPDIVLAGSGLTAPAALIAARTTGARACAYLHGLDAAVRHPVYRLLWHPAIRCMDTIIANSLPTARLASELGVMESRLRIVHPGTHWPDTPQPAHALRAFRERHGLGDGRFLLSIGRLTSRKGLREFVEHVLPAVVHAAPDIILAVIGDAPSDSLHASVQTRDSIQAIADAAGVGRNLRFLGIITDPLELACAYECAALHIFPVRSIPGDPEGFGMVAIEAAAHGLPTVAFATGGIVDAVANDRSGKLVPPGDYTALRDAILPMLADQEGAWRSGCRSFSLDFAWPVFGEKLARALDLDITPHGTGRALQ